MAPKSKPLFDPKIFLAKVGTGRTIAEYLKDQMVFSQGDPANAIFYIRKGKIKLTVVSNNGKEAVIRPDERGEVDIITASFGVHVCPTLVPAATGWQLAQGCRDFGRAGRNRPQKLKSPPRPEPGGRVRGFDAIG